MRTLRIGIRSHEEAKARLLAIARGEISRDENEPTIWVTSLGSLAQLLSPENTALLDLIRDREPESVTELSTLSGRSVPSLSRSLTKMEEYGLVAMVEHGRAHAPRVAFDRLEIVVIERPPVDRQAA